MKALFTIITIVLVQSASAQYMDTIYYLGKVQAVTITSVTKSMVYYRVDPHQEKSITNEEQTENWNWDHSITKSIVDSVYINNAQSPYTLNHRDAHFGIRLQRVGYLMLSSAVVATLGVLIPGIVIVTATASVVLNVVAVIELIKAGKNAVWVENDRDGNRVIVF
jgi:hypothetical protein